MHAMKVLLVWLVALNYVMVGWSVAISLDRWGWRHSFDVAPFGHLVVWALAWPVFLVWRLYLALGDWREWRARQVSNNREYKQHLEEQERRAAIREQADQGIRERYQNEKCVFCGVANGHTSDCPMLPCQRCGHSQQQHGPYIGGYCAVLLCDCPHFEG